MSVRDMINKLEVLEEIIQAIEELELSHREDARRFEEKYTEDSKVAWLKAAAVSSSKAGHCRAYIDMLIKHEIK